MMHDYGFHGWGMGLYGWLVGLILVLAVLALIKYLTS